MLYRDCQDAQDKQQTQYLLTPRSKWKMHPSLLKIPKSECPDVWILLPKHKWPKSWSSMEDPVVPLESEIVRSSFSRTVMGKAIREVPIRTRLGKSSKLEMLIRLNRERKDYSCLCMWMTWNGWEERKHWPDVEHTHERSWFGRADIIPWPCLFGLLTTRMPNNQRYCRQLQIYVWIQNLCRSNRTATLFWETWRKHFLMVPWCGRSCKKCVERYCELANTTTQQLYKVSTPCNDDHQFKEEKWDLSENCHKFAHKLFKCMYLARIGKPDIFWSVNKLARAVTKWTKSCDKLLARLISHIHHTCEFKQYCHVGNTAQQCRLGLFQDSDFAGDLEDSKTTSRGLLCIFGSHTSVPISWMCKKQTSVSHSCTEAEIISVDPGLRMDGIPAIDLWDLVKEVFDSSPNQFNNTKDQARGNSSRNTTSNKHNQNQTKVSTQHDNFDLTNVDHVPSNAKFSRFGAML